MSKHTSIVLTDTASKIVDEYAQEHNWTSNKAINELIVAHEDSDKLDKLLKISSAIFKKVSGWLLI